MRLPYPAWRKLIDFLWKDVAFMYTGLSRVKSADDYLIGGFVQPNHFAPACEGWRRRLGKRPHGHAFEPTNDPAMHPNAPLFPVINY